MVLYIISCALEKYNFTHTPRYHAGLKFFSIRNNNNNKVGCILKVLTFKNKKHIPIYYTLLEIKRHISKDITIILRTRRQSFTSDVKTNKYLNSNQKLNNV